MSDELIVLGQRDLDKLRRLVDESVSRRINTVERIGDQTIEHQEQQGPEVYIAKTDSSGIPGLTFGSSSDPYSHPDRPGYADCSLYRIQLEGETDSSGEPGLILTPVPDKRVYNLSTTAVDGDAWVLIARDKSGKWLVTGVLGQGEETETGTGTNAAEDCGDYRVLCLNGWLVQYRCNAFGEWVPDTDLGVPCDNVFGPSDPNLPFSTLYPTVFDVVTNVCPVKDNYGYVTDIKVERKRIYIRAWGYVSDPECYIAEDECCTGTGTGVGGVYCCPEGISSMAAIVASGPIGLAGATVNFDFNLSLDLTDKLSWSGQSTGDDGRSQLYVKLECIKEKYAARWVMSGQWRGAGHGSTVHNFEVGTDFEGNTLVAYIPVSELPDDVITVVIQSPCIGMMDTGTGTSSNPTITPVPPPPSPILIGGCDHEWPETIYGQFSNTGGPSCDCFNGAKFPMVWDGTKWVGTYTGCTGTVTMSLTPTVFTGGFATWTVGKSATDYTLSDTGSGIAVACTGFTLGTIKSYGVSGGCSGAVQIQFSETL